MELRLNLITAMTLRKRLNLLASILESNLCSNVYADPDEYEQLKSNFITGSFDGDLTLYDNTLATIGRLNRVIEEHNLEGKTLLESIKLANRRIATFSAIASAQSVNHKNRVRNPVSGEWEITEFVPFTQSNGKELLACAQKQKNITEDELTTNNGSTCFDFELDDEVHSRAYEV